MKPAPVLHAAALPAPRRRRALGWALAATLVLTAWSAWQDDSSVGVAEATTRRQEPRAVTLPRSPPSASLSWPDGPAARPVPARLADASAWLAPAAEPVAAPPAAKPAPLPQGPEPARAPVFAYALIGRLDDGAPQALLSGPVRSLAVRIGEVVDDQWRIDSIGVDGVAVTWLPAGISQRLGFKSP